MHRKSAYILFLAVLGLLVIGIVMLFSTSAFARDSHGDVYFFIKRQAMWVGIGLFLCIFAALIDYHFWRRTWWLWFGLALASLARCGVVSRLLRASYPRYAKLRSDGAALWVSSPAKLVRGRWLAADAGVDRLGQRLNGRASPGQRAPEDALSTLRAHRFYFSN